MNNINKKTNTSLIVAIVVGVFLIIVSAFFLYSKKNTPTAYKESIERHTLLIAELVNNSDLIEMVQIANRDHASLTQEEINRLDLEWRETTDENKLMKSLIDNKTAQVLRAFRQNNPGFPEIFITDKYGLNVAQTNRTTDYYQADEDWWVGAYNSGQGRTYYGEIEYDESARKWSTPIYVPIFNLQGETIGIIKALLDVEKIR